MFKKLNNQVSKEIYEAMELDLDSIHEEEYEEIHYVPSIKVHSTMKVRRAKQEELDRIEKLLAKKHHVEGLDDYFEVKEAIEEETLKEYKGSKSKVYNELTPEEFENKMIYTLKWIIPNKGYENNIKFINTLDYLKSNYKPYEYMIIVDKIKDIRKIYILEENTFDRDIFRLSPRQLKDYQDKVDILLESTVEKIVLNESVLRNTFIIKDSLETMLSDSCPILSLLQEYYLSL